jgi:hypothetical protein
MAWERALWEAPPVLELRTTGTAAVTSCSLAHHLQQLRVNYHAAERTMVFHGCWSVSGSSSSCLQLVQQIWASLRTAGESLAAKS